MTGLEKITERILADARADAEKVKQEAAEKAAEMRRNGEAEARAITERGREKLEQDCEDMILRARSAAEMTRRELLLRRQAQLVDAAFDAALEDLLAMDEDHYGALLVSLLCKALSGQHASEEESMRLYGEDICPDVYTVLLNKKDRDTFGSEMVARARRYAEGKKYASMLNRVEISEQTASITGGLILRCGDIETNCSFSMMLAEMREQLEPQIADILFHDQTVRI